MTRVQKPHQFKLSADEYNFLRQVLADDEALARLLPREADARADKFIFVMDVTQAERIRAHLTKRLAESGFDKDYSPTKQGQTLEELIDRFYVP